MAGPSDVQDQGFKLEPRLLPPAEIDKIILALGQIASAGQRGRLTHPLVNQIASSEACLSAVRPYVKNLPRPVRAIYFDKSAAANWLVPWHQDLTISVTSRIDAPGFGPWSTKDGLIHVQPPVELLADMITLRIHLDDTDETNGALRVIPGSHRYGRLPPTEIERLRTAIPAETCRASRGDALLMRPLILHASSRSTTKGHRRILHIEYAGDNLPHGLHWNDHA
jgi:hypothetical protein